MYVCTLVNVMAVRSHLRGSLSHIRCSKSCKLDMVRKLSDETLFWTYPGLPSANPLDLCSGV